MAYKHHIEHCLAEKIGAGGLSAEEFERALEKAGSALKRLSKERGTGRRPFLDLPGRRDDLSDMEKAAAHFRERVDDVLVLGTGGSSLGARTLAALAARGMRHHSYGPRLHFLDNVDPDSFDALFGSLDFAKCGLIAISKSGTTAETLAQLLALLPRVDSAALPSRSLIVTEEKPSPLSSLAERFAIPTLSHDPALGGRFSVLSLVGLLPAAIAGVDILAVRAGALEALERALGSGPADSSPPAVGAAIAVGLAREGRASQNVLFTYADRLIEFGLWYRQLWAESLGKGGMGTTPVPALGTVDQHSQLQLYLDGPADKLFTVIRLETAGLGPVIDKALAEETGLDYLAGRSVGDLFDAEARATTETLIRRGRPVRRIELESLDEGVLGALLMHFMLETVIAADLMGIDPYDQPAVEDGKRLTRAYLSEKG